MTVKISYTCMDNMAKIITSHNKKILNEISATPEGPCNCNDKPNCPLNGPCLASNIVYKAVVTSNDNKPDMTYYGTSKTPFKARWSNHKNSFHDRSKINNTELSKYIWGLQDKNIEYSISWSIAKRTGGYNPVTKNCNLCIAEKLLICNFRDKNTLLNKRSEMVSKCRHQLDYLLSAQE